MAPRPELTRVRPAGGLSRHRERSNRCCTLAEPGREGSDISGSDEEVRRARTPRPLFERLGLAFVALVLAALFAAVALAAWSGGELFMVAMGATGCLMTLWVGALTLFRE